MSVNTAFSPYPMSIGAKRLGCSPAHAGPASYTAVTTGPLAGGDTLTAAELGLVYIEHVFTGITSDGLYRVEVMNPTAVPVTSVKLRWTVMATGVQAGAINLSASLVNLLAIGW